MEAYKQMRNRINRNNIQLKRNYFANKISLLKGDIKGTWKTINSVLNLKLQTLHRLILKEIEFVTIKI